MRFDHRGDRAREDVGAVPLPESADERGDGVTGLEP